MSGASGSRPPCTSEPRAQRLSKQTGILSLCSLCLGLDPAVVAISVSLRIKTTQPHTQLWVRLALEELEKEKNGKVWMDERGKKTNFYYFNTWLQRFELNLILIQPPPEPNSYCFPCRTAAAERSVYVEVRRGRLLRRRLDFIHLFFTVLPKGQHRL